MSRRDRNATTPLTPRELAVLQALRDDREACGPGVDRADVALAGDTRWPEGVISRLIAYGYVVGEKDGHYELSHDEPEAA